MRCPWAPDCASSAAMAAADAPSGLRTRELASAGRDRDEGTGDYPPCKEGHEAVSVAAAVAGRKRGRHWVRGQWRAVVHMGHRLLPPHAGGWRGGLARKLLANNMEPIQQMEDMIRLSFKI